MEAALSSILEALFQKTGHDFRGYRESTLARRITRRLHTMGAANYQGYLQHLEASPEECRHLLTDLTIRVTDFFRDWLEEVLRSRIWPELSLRPLIKIWSAGCATGEEAYSLAISFDWFLKERGLKTEYHVLGSDLNEDSLEVARGGTYPEEKLKNLSLSLREEYFRPVGGQYEITPSLREAVDFRKVDLVNAENPSVRDLDLIVCRNVLIYFSRDLQERVLSGFYDALKQDGVLWLGKAESLGGRAVELFEPVDKGAKIFRRRRR